MNDCRRILRLLPYPLPGMLAAITSYMKKFILLSYGYETPTPEIMSAWGAWFATIADHIVDRGGLGGGKEISDEGVKELSRETGAATGYIIFNAASMEEAEAIAKGCPVIAKNVVQEIMSMGDC